MTTEAGMATKVGNSGSSGLQQLEGYIRLLTDKYALRTQVSPAPIDEIVEGLWEGISDSKSISRLRSRSSMSPSAARAAQALVKLNAAVDAIVEQVFERGDYRFVVRDEHKNYSMVKDGQLPTASIPTGEIMDLPLDAYLRSRGTGNYLASFVHNALRRNIPDARQFSMCLASSSRLWKPEQGYTYTLYSNVLTVGGAVAFLSGFELNALRSKRMIGKGVIDALVKHVVSNPEIRQLAEAQGYKLPEPSRQ